MNPAQELEGDKDRDSGCRPYDFGYGVLVGVAIVAGILLLDLLSGCATL